MSVADLHDLELVWPSLGPTDVIVTGTFDQWSSSIHLVKGDTGFSGTVKVPWGQKVAYKFLVDGRWRCRDDRPQEDDGHGNINNVFRTPEKPQLPAVHDPPARLSIPFDGAQNEGYGDIENMVTAVEFLPSAEPHTIKGSLPLPIPQISITADALAQAPSVGTPVSESKLNTAAATEGHISPTSETPAKPFKEPPLSCDVPPLPINGSGSPLVPSVNGTTHDSFPSVPETAKEEALFAPLQFAVPQLNLSSHAAQDTPALTKPVDVPAAVLEPTTKQSQVEIAAQDPQQATSSTSIALATTPSAPASGASTRKKRQSWFAKIKHIFDKDHDKQERKKNKH